MSIKTEDPAVLALDEITGDAVRLPDGRVLRHPFEGPNREARRLDRRQEKHRVHAHVTTGGGHAVLERIGTYDNGYPIVVGRRGWGQGFSRTKVKPWEQKKVNRRRAAIAAASRKKNRP